MRIENKRLLEENEQIKASAHSMVTAVISTIGGTVEGHPTSELNYLQRLRQLVELERAYSAFVGWVIRKDEV